MIQAVVSLHVLDMYLFPLKSSVLSIKRPTYPENSSLAPNRIDENSSPIEKTHHQKYKSKCGQSFW